MFGTVVSHGRHIPVADENCEQDANYFPAVT